MVGGVVIGREGIRVRAHAMHDAVIDLPGALLRPAEHHVLKEVREAGHAFFHLIA